MLLSDCKGLYYCYYYYYDNHHYHYYYYYYYYYYDYLDRIPVGGGRFSTPVQTGSGAHPAFLYNGYRVSFPGVERPVCGVDHPPHQAPRLKEE